MKSEISLIFLIKSCFLHEQKVKTKCKYLENEKSFYDEIKSIFHHFQRAFSDTNRRWGYDFKALDLSIRKMFIDVSDIRCYVHIKIEINSDDNLPLEKH